MLKNITFSADENLIREARRRAAMENTTLNELFRQWLGDYVEESDVEARQRAVAEDDELMQGLGHVDAGRKFGREELNERR